MKNTFVLTFVVLSCGVLADTSRADFVEPAFGFSINADGVASNGQACDYGTVSHVGSNQWFFQGFTTHAIGTTLSWAYLVDPDPFITGTFTLSNATASTQAYVVDFTLPISPAMSASTISGQMAGTLTDADGSGSALMTSIGGGPVYTALADDIFVHGLMSNANQSVSTQFGTTSFSGGSFGQGAPLAGPAINSTIAIRFSFNLSAGDSVSFSSIFVANPVPAPGAIALGLLATVFARRSRRRS